MELRHLRYFVAVAEMLHFGQAAKRLAIAQPPLSQQIKALEEEVGVVLLNRTKRQVLLTPAGKVFLKEARKILSSAEYAVQAAQRAARGQTGQLGIGFVSSAVYGQVPAIFHLMRTRCPEVSLNLQELSSEEQAGAIEAGNIDVGFARPPVRATEVLQMQVIWEEPLIVALPESNPLATMAEIAISALAEQPFIQLPRTVAPNFYDLLMRTCVQAGFAPIIVQEARTTSTIVNLIAGGIGISLLPASIQGLQRTGVVYRPLCQPSPTVAMAVIWHRDNTSPPLDAFLKIIREFAGI